MKIYLIGMPLSGKSTIGKILSKRIGYEFRDLDTFIENTYNISINELILNDKEIDFRLLEEKALKECLKKDNLIISTGGGIVERSSNLALMDGKIIFLDVPLEVLKKRKEKSKERPLLKTISLDSLYKRRIDKYNSFTKTSVKEVNIDIIIEVILKLLEEEGII